MAGKGGYQRPTSPAPVSGPGSLSQRTDGGPAHKQSAKYISGLPYGQGQEMMNTQSSAPMEASTPTPNPAPASAIASAGSQSQDQPAEPMPIVPLSAPTQRPDEYVTHGADAGPGPGLESLGLNVPEANAYQHSKDYIQALARSTDASPALKALAQSFNGAF
jgi:hypothetical protein